MQHTLEVLRRLKRRRKECIGNARTFFSPHGADIFHGGAQVDDATPEVIHDGHPRRTSGCVAHVVAAVIAVGPERLQTVAEARRAQGRYLFSDTKRNRATHREGTWQHAMAHTKNRVVPRHRRLSSGDTDIDKQELFNSGSKRCPQRQTDTKQRATSDGSGCNKQQWKYPACLGLTRLDSSASCASSRLWPLALSWRSASSSAASSPPTSPPNRT